ncbi:MAG: hypothetical protein GW905_02040 [Rhodobacterales bacterium]|nr:hypothetical protein [Rhodobacterales bacterium]NCO86010.1 hypothetical protein [Rhodobacterales bacterium]NCT11715.1 hypothetical protein [Rhodobacterales bacterium]
MTDPIWRVGFWVAMVFAVVIKLRASPTITILGAALTTVAAVAGALIFTDPVAVWLGFSGDGARFAVSEGSGFCPAG